MIDWSDETSAVTLLRDRGIESDLDNPALHAYAKAAVEEIAARGYGPQTDIVTYHAGGGRLIALDPPAALISKVTEEGTELDEDDNYRVLSGGQYLERLQFGFSSVWSGRVVVTRDAHTAGARYDRVVLDLVKLALEFNGLDSRRDGDYGEESKGARGGGGQLNYAAEREQLIDELAPPWGFA